MPKSKRKFRLRDWIAYGEMDTGFFMIVMLLLAVGVVMMFSASYVYAAYSSKTGYKSDYYFLRQVRVAVIGIVGMLILSRIRVEAFKRWAFLIMLACVALLILVLLYPKEIEGNEDVKRWLVIPGIKFAFQPSEFAKLGLIIICARVLSKHGKKRKHSMKIDYSVPVSLGITLLFAGLISAEHHLSCTILMLGIGAVMLVLGGIAVGWIVLAIGGAVGGLMTFLTYHEAIIEMLPIDQYQKNRLSSWLDKDSYAPDLRWQTNQSLYAIGSGGLFGQGLGQSKQKHLYMPEPQNDFVFAIVCEELGFIGAVFILVLFAVLIWRGFVVAMRNKDRFSALLVMGIMSQVGLQTILNILVVTDTIPNTGIGLPFFSYGGTSLLVLLCEMGMVLSVSRTSNIRKN